MAQAVINNPVINSPFTEPKQHFRFADDGITNEIVTGRRPSSYFTPIAKPKTKGKGPQLDFGPDWSAERIEENKFINYVRGRVGLWRQGGYQGITKVTQRLLMHWRSPKRERPLFFCQVEALETAIYVTEVARKFGDVSIENDLRRFNEDANPGLYRAAFKMATGSGKSAVMAMLIAWHALNKAEYPQDARFSDTFLIVTPGITIRDRLRVLLPGDSQNYYSKMDIVPIDLLDRMGEIKIVITNYHAFKLRERGDAGRLTKSILTQGQPSPFTETPDQMVRRVCRDLGNKKNIVVLNDEAHHCYRRKPDVPVEKLAGDERQEAESREEAARQWISGIEAVKAKSGVRAVYDLSATPFFLRGSGYPEGSLFPWVVSDFALIDAIEAGIVKVPRVPVADGSTDDLPLYRNLWPRIRDGLPKRGRGADAEGGPPKLPQELEGALHALYGNYVKSYKLWEENDAARTNGLTPPVFIVVCANTFISKIIFDYIAGYAKTLPDGTTVVAQGELPLFSNVRDGRFIARPNTILIDSQQLESGEGMSDDFKKIAAQEIEEFKADYRARFPGRDADDLTDEDLLREVMNTVGKTGKLGEHVRCVVSVSMLTEGWDANTVTHVLGVRAFGTQLLCEQVVGRALRRMSYATNDKDMFDPEYAEVFGVPFSFIPTAGVNGPKPPPPAVRVRALPERIDCEITFPRVVGYRYELPAERLNAEFNNDSLVELSARDIPTRTENAPIIGQSEWITLDDVERRRLQEVDFRLARLILRDFYKDGEGYEKPWLFPDLLAICRRWRTECLVCKDGTFPQLLLFQEPARAACDRIYHSVVRGTKGEKCLKPILRPYEPEGTTRTVDFATVRPVFVTDPHKCHVSHVASDSGWEQTMAQVLEGMAAVRCYVKNQNLGFSIPYTLDGEEHQYVPDFMARVDDGHGDGDLLNLVIEVTGESDAAKKAKTATARTMWVPAVNNCAEFGRWDFVEVLDPYDAAHQIINHIARDPLAAMETR